MPCGKIVLFLGLNAAVAVLALGLTALLGRSSAGNRASVGRYALYACGLWIALIQVIILLAGVAGLLTRTGVGCIVAGLLVLALIVPGFREALRRIPVAMFDHIRSLNGGGSAAAAAVVFLTLAMACTTARDPQVVDWDDDAYHVTYPTLWLRDGVIRVHPFNYKAFYPQADGVQALWFMLPFRGRPQAEMLAWVGASGLAFVALFAAATATIGWKLKAPNTAWLTAVACLLSSKYVLFNMIQATDADVGCAAALLGAVAAALPVQDHDRDSWTTLADAVLCGLLLGLAVGIKPLAGLPGIVIVFAMVWRLLRSGSVRVAVAGMALLLGCTLLIGGYWYVRNLAWYGNPVYPAKLGSLPGELTFPLTRLSEYRELFGTKRAILDAIKAYTDLPHLWGALAIGGLLAATRGVIRRPKGFAEPAVWFGAITVGITALVVAYLPWQPFGAGWAWNISAREVHPHSQRYLFAVAFLGWTWVGLAAAQIGWPAAFIPGLLAGIQVERFIGNHPVTDVTTTLTLGLLFMSWAVVRWGPGLARGWAEARPYVRSITGVLCAVGLLAGAEALHKYRTRLNSQAQLTSVWGAFNAQAPGRVWGYSMCGFHDLAHALGGRCHHQLIRVDENGRLTTIPEPEMDMVGKPYPAATVTLDEFLKNLRESGIDYLITVGVRFGGRDMVYPHQFYLLSQSANVRQLAEGLEHSYHRVLWKIAPEDGQ